MASQVIPVPANFLLESATLTLSRLTSLLQSPYTGNTQVVSYPYSVWRLTGMISQLDGADAVAVRSFLAQLRGRSNTFRMPVPGAQTPASGYVGAAGQVSGANQTGNSLVTTGWAHSTPILADGDYFTVNDELKMCVGGGIASNSGGQATIDFEPAIRKSPANGATVTVSNPWIMLRANTDDIATWDLEMPVLHTFKLDAFEAISI